MAFAHFLPKDWSVFFIVNITPLVCQLLAKFFLRRARKSAHARHVSGLITFISGTVEKGANIVINYEKQGCGP